MFHLPTKYCQKGLSDANYGNNGDFMIGRIRIRASDGEGWEHVSASLSDRTPRWNEMCKIKDLFWDDEDVVIQYHPAKSEYVNNHPFALHLWRPVNEVIPTPSMFMV